MAPRKRKASELKDESDGDEGLIIALDFGTTYSGIAYCFTHKEAQQATAILNWPDNRGVTAPKIPTLVSYSKDNLEDWKWGASAEKDLEVIVGIKLLLDPSQQRPAYLPSGNMNLDVATLPKSPTEIASDFMKGIYKHALAEISKTTPKAYVDICTKKFVVTVPAVWSDAAKHATLSAAEDAGIHPVIMIKEPEAAALYAAKSFIEAIRPILQVKELVPGTGGMSGSLGLNMRFKAEVQALVGESHWHALQGTKGWAMAEKQFDTQIKPAFGGYEDEEYFVNFPMAKKLPLKERDGSKDLKRIFSPLLDDIIQLIDGQVSQSFSKRNGKPVTGILLVGGFGGSLYLRERVQKHFPDIEVIQPQDAWAAVVKGAVLSQLPRQTIVTSTVATRHYGIELGHVYDRARDLGQPTTLDREGTVRCNVMEWWIHTGDDIQRDQVFKYEVSADLDYDYGPKDLSFAHMLYQCEDSYKVTFSLVLTIKSAMITFSLEIDGKTMGTVEASFEN
ncbi:hypothetical protein C2857_006028 [Epichloe festucae Fl1]|uniref:Uncharacterized protein n=1 Tax=Epichloe festucae (strain Fl1) TaxID=877507 RepID=A0A7S9KQ64_EPIFF|nr:hypothetical protein C2857_006028 [Epichloe festucae Fl1]